FMDPGETAREDFITGSAAAAVGGTTTVIEHTHATPVLDAEGLRRKVAHLRRRSLVDFALAAHVWPDRLSGLREVWEAGAAYLKVFTCETHGVPAILAGHLLRCFRAAAEFGGLLLVHCEDDAMTRERERALHEAGRTDPGVIPEWRSREAEEVAAAETALLARLAGARVVIAHTSHPEAVELIARERARGGRLWVESCPQYFFLLEAEVLRHGPFRKFTPPARLGSAEGAGQMWRLLTDGAISHLSTDHAPATRRQKEGGDIWQAPFGLPGVETTLTLLLHAAHHGWVSLERVVDALCERPARLYGFYPRKGSLLPGADADVTLVDPGRTQSGVEPLRGNGGGGRTGHDLLPGPPRGARRAPAGRPRLGAVAARGGKEEWEWGLGFSRSTSGQSARRSGGPSRMRPREGLRTPRCCASWPATPWRSTPSMPAGRTRSTGGPSSIPSRS
ncbi:MAG: hypothetical protein E6H04_00700, partial [Bacillati bacterium ANGP1]